MILHIFPRNKLHSKFHSRLTHNMHKVKQIKYLTMGAQHILPYAYSGMYVDGGNTAHLDSVADTQVYVFVRNSSKCVLGGRCLV